MRKTSRLSGESLMYIEFVFCEGGEVKGVYCRRSHVITSVGMPNDYFVRRHHKVIKIWYSNTIFIGTKIKFLQRAECKKVSVFLMICHAH